MTRPSTPQEVDQVIIDLRRDGVSLSAIAAVLKRYHGWRLTEGQVRHRAKVLGVGKGVNWASRYCSRRALANQTAQLPSADPFSVQSAATTGVQ